jgi:hypothetical protein
VPVKLHFKDAKMQKAGLFLKTNLVMALRELTVTQFLEEVLKSMRVKLRKSERINVVFRGWSCTAPIEF